VTAISRPWLYLLLAAALFMRAFLPQGYMAERSSDGVIAVTLCNSDGVHLIPIRKSANSDEDRQRVAPPCAFAGLAELALPPAPDFELPERKLASSSYVRPAERLVRAEAPRHHPPARGPPLTA
jgi:hypothetical protein